MKIPVFKILQIVPAIVAMFKPRPMWEDCPNAFCQNGLINFSPYYKTAQEHYTCPTCKGTGIINRKTGKPPER
jgi:hypothetical protein